MAEYDKAIALAKRLIDKKGRTVTLMLSENAASDEGKPWEVNEVQRRSVDVKAVLVPIESKYVDGTTVMVTDKQMYLAAADVTFPITPQAKVRDKGYDNQVIKVETLEPGDQVVLYTVIIR